MRDIGKEMREELDFFKQFTKPKTKMLVEYKQDVDGTVEYEDYEHNKEVPDFWQAHYTGMVSDIDLETNFLSFYKNSHEVNGKDVPSNIFVKLEDLARADAEKRAKQSKDWIKKGEE